MDSDTKKPIFKKWLLSGLALLFFGCAPPHVLTQEESAFSIAMMNQPTTFTIAKDKSEDAWGRANVFVTKFSDLRTQTATNYSISTYSPFQISQYGYEITRSPEGDSAEIAVTCQWFAGNVFSNQAKEADQNAHAAAYYIATGKLNQIFVYH